MPAWLLARVEKQGEESHKPLTAKKIPLQLRRRVRRWAEAGYTRELERLSKAPLHQRNNTLNLCVFRAGQLAARGLVDRAKATSEVATIAKTIGLDETEIERTIESAFRAGLNSPAQIPFVDGRRARTHSGPTSVSEAALVKELARLGETDTDNAERFVKRCSARVIFSPSRGWMVYDGSRFTPDAQLACVELAKEVATRIPDEAGLLSDAKAIAARIRFSQYSKSKGGIDRMLDLAKSRLVVDDATLDLDPWLLNTEAFTIDLWTGTYQRHDPRSHHKGRQGKGKARFSMPNVPLIPSTDHER